MKDYYRRINDLRRELTAEIVEYLKGLPLNFINIPDEDDYEDGTWVMWVDDDGNAYDGRVVKLSLYGEGGFSVDVEDNWNNTATLYSGCDVGCNHVEWLESMLSMLKNLIDGENWHYNPETGEVICIEKSDEQ